jgi:hypothetical protein
MAEKQTKGKRVNKKHFIIFNNGGVISATTPKDWARAHQELFKKFNFTDGDNTPPVDTIENYLVKIKGYSKIENDEIIILYPYLKL